MVTGVGLNTSKRLLRIEYKRLPAVAILSNPGVAVETGVRWPLEKTAKLGSY